jgi:hypothetical protein
MHAQQEQQDKKVFSLDRNLQMQYARASINRTYYFRFAIIASVSATVANSPFRLARFIL